MPGSCVTAQLCLRLPCDPCVPRKAEPCPTRRLRQRVHFLRRAFQHLFGGDLPSACAGQLPAGSTPDSPMAAKVLAAQQRKSRFHPSHAAPSSARAGAGAGPSQPAQAAATPHKAVTCSDQLTPGSGRARRSLGSAVTPGSGLRQAPGSSRPVSGSRGALLATPGRTPGQGSQTGWVRVCHDRDEAPSCCPSSQDVPCCALDSHEAPSCVPSNQEVPCCPQTDAFGSMTG